MVRGPVGRTCVAPAQFVRKWTAPVAPGSRPAGSRPADRRLVQKWCRTCRTRFSMVPTANVPAPCRNGVAPVAPGSHRSFDRCLPWPAERSSSRPCRAHRGGLRTETVSVQKRCRTPFTNNARPSGLNMSSSCAVRAEMGSHPVIAAVSIAASLDRPRRRLLVQKRCRTLDGARPSGPDRE